MARLPQPVYLRFSGNEEASCCQNRLVVTEDKTFFSRHGYSFFRSELINSLNAGQSRKILLYNSLPSTRYVCLTVDAATSELGFIYLFENPTFSTLGDQLTTYCRRRSNPTSNNIRLYENSTITDNGTAIIQLHLSSLGLTPGSGQSDNTLIDGGLVIKPESYYLIVFTSGDRDCIVSFGIRWDEL